MNTPAFLTNLYYFCIKKDMTWESGWIGLISDQVLNCVPDIQWTRMPSVYSVYIEARI